LSFHMPVVSLSSFIHPKRLGLRNSGCEEPAGRFAVFLFRATHLVAAAISQM
jgi:hypothetical protein